MCKIRNERDKNKTIIALKIGICILVVLNIIMFLYFYCNSETILIESESLVLTIVGILTAFVVISNYSQVLNIKNETKEYVEKLEKEFENRKEKYKEIEDFYDRLKQRILETGDISASYLEFLKDTINNLQINKTDKKYKYLIVKIINNSIPKLYKNENVNIETLKLILNLFEFDNDKPETYLLNKNIYELSISYFEHGHPPNSETLIDILTDKFNNIAIDAINKKYNNLVFNIHLYYINRLYYHSENMFKFDSNFYKDFNTNYFNNMNEEYHEIFNYHKTIYKEKKYTYMLNFANSKLKDEYSKINKKIKDYIEECEMQTKTLGT